MLKSYSIVSLFFFFSVAYGASKTDLLGAKGSTSLDDQVLCFIGDTGHGSKEQYEVSRAMEKLECDQVRVLGDLIYPDGLKDKDDLLFISKFYAPYRPLLEAQIPFYMVLGNHDYRQNPEAWLDLAKLYPQIRIPSRYYAEKYDDVCLITLDTTPLAQFFLGPNTDQVQWLRQQLTDFKASCRLSLVMAHHPYKSSGAHRDAGGKLKKFLESEVIGKVDMYLTGHDHQLSHEGESKGTVLLISGAGGEVRPLVSTPAVFGASKAGLFTLQVKRKSTGERWALFKFYAAENNTLKVLYEGSKIGQGIR